MPSLLEILNDPNYTGANAATKQAIFDKYSTQDENYTGANDPTKQAIRERFGLIQPQAAPAQTATTATPAQETLAATSAPTISAPTTPARTGLISRQLEQMRGEPSRELDYLGSATQRGLLGVESSALGQRMSGVANRLQAYGERYTPEQIAANPKLQEKIARDEELYASLASQVKNISQKSSDILKGPNTRPSSQLMFGVGQENRDWAQTAADFGKAIAKDPGAIVDLGLSSAIPSLGMAATSTLTFMATKNPYLAAAAGGGASASVEFGNEYAENRAAGMDHKEAWAAAAKKAGVVGALDAVSMRTAGKTLDAVWDIVKSGKNVSKEIVKRVGKETGVQAGLGASGEALGSIAAGKPVDPTSVFAEAIGEAVTSPIEAVSMKAQTEQTPSQLVGRALQEDVNARNFTSRGAEQEAVARLSPEQAQLQRRGEAPEGIDTQRPFVAPLAAQPPEEKQAAVNTVTPEQRANLIAIAQNDNGLPLDVATALVDEQIAAETAARQPAALKTAAVTEAPKTGEEVAAKLKQMVEDPSVDRSTIGALREAYQKETGKIAPLEVVQAVWYEKKKQEQEKANANISTVPTSTGTGTADVGAGAATDIQQQLGQSAGQIAGAQPDGMASAGASAAQPAAGKVGEPSALDKEWEEANSAHSKALAIVIRAREAFEKADNSLASDDPKLERSRKNLQLAEEKESDALAAFAAVVEKQNKVKTAAATTEVTSKPTVPTDFAVKEILPAESTTGKRAWNVTGPAGEVLGTFDKKGDATARATQARKEAREAAGKKQAGRPAVLTPEQRAEREQLRRENQATNITATRTAQKLLDNISSNALPDPNKLDEYNAQRVATIALALDIATNPAHRMNTAGEIAKQVLQHPSINNRERTLAVIASNGLRETRGETPLDQTKLEQLFLAKRLTARAEPNASAQSETETVKANPGANMQRLAKMLGAKLYGKPDNIAAVSIKELVQNAFDAIKESIEKTGLVKGTINIKIDPVARTITIIDNGAGMPSSVMGNEFLQIAGTVKNTDRPSGGLGVAKMLFLYENDRLEVVSLRNGVVSRMVTTGDELKAVLGVDPNTVGGPTAPNVDISRNPKTVETYTKNLFPEGHGTAVTVQIPVSYVDSSDGKDVSIPFNEHSFANLPVLKFSPLFDNINVEITIAGYAPVTKPIGANFPIQDYTTFANVRFKWGVARIYVSKEIDKNISSSSSNTYVLSNGLWQFSTTIKDRAGWDGEPVKRSFYIDVSPSPDVKPEDSGYPFDLNRQSFSSAVKPDFEKIFTYITALYTQIDLAAGIKDFGIMQYVDLDGNLTAPKKVVPTAPPSNNAFTLMKPGDAVEVRDGVLYVNNRAIPELTADDLKDIALRVDELRIPQSEIDPDKVMVHDNTMSTDTTLFVPSGQDAEAKSHVLLMKLEKSDPIQFKLTPFVDVTTGKPAKGSYEWTWTNPTNGFSTSEEGTPTEILRQIFEGGFYDKAIEVIRSFSPPTPSISDLARTKFGKRYDQYLAHIGTVLSTLRGVLIAADPSKYDELGKEAIGVSIDNEYYGVNIRIPFRGIFINPATTDFYDTPKKIAVSMMGTMAHELAHYYARSHNASFANEMQRVITLLDTDDVFNFGDAKNALTRFIADNIDIFNFLNKEFRSGNYKNRGNKFQDASNQQIRDASTAQSVENLVDAGSQGEDGVLGRTGERPATTEQEQQRAGINTQTQNATYLISSLTASTNGTHNPIYSTFKNASEALLWIRKNGNKFEKNLADLIYVYTRSRKIRLEIVTDINTLPDDIRAEFESNPAGVYSDNVIYLNAKSGMSNTIFLHEALHGATLQKMYDYLSNKELGKDVNPEYEQAFDTLIVTMERAKRRYDLLKEAGMLDDRMLRFEDLEVFTNPFEFVTYGLTDSDVQEFLLQTRGESRTYLGKVFNTLMDNFVSGIRAFFKMGEQHQSAMQDLIIATHKLVTTSVNATGIRVAPPAAAKKVNQTKAKVSKAIEAIKASINAYTVSSGISAGVKNRSNPGWFTLLKSRYDAYSTGTLRAILYSSPTSYVVNWKNDEVPGLKRIDDLTQRMSSMRSNMQAAYAKKAKQLTAFVTKNGQQVIGSAMHLARLHEVSPTKYINRADALANDPDAKAYDAKSVDPQYDPAKQRAYKGRATTRRRDINEVFDAWEALGKQAGGHDMYKMVRQFYIDNYNIIRSILNTQIQALPIDAAAKEKLLKSVRVMQEQERIDENGDKTKAFPEEYFPFMRYGENWLRVKSGPAGRAFYTFDDATSRNDFLNEEAVRLKVSPDNGNIFQAGSELTSLRKDFANGSLMLQQMFSIIDDATTAKSVAGASPVLNPLTAASNIDKFKEDLKDQLYQVYLLTLPERSIRKQFLHAENVTGFSSDILRNFKTSATKMANQAAKLKYATDIQNEISAARSSLAGRPPLQFEKLSLFVNEMAARAAEEINPPPPNTLVSVANHMAFMWLLTSAASAAVQFLSVPTMVMGRLNADYGYVNAAAKFMKYAFIFKSVGVTKKEPNGDVTYTAPSIGNSNLVKSNTRLQKAFDAAVDRQITTETNISVLTNNKRTPENTPTNKFTSATQQIYGVITGMFSGAERLSREMTYMMAFELAFDKTNDFNASVEQAVKIVQDTLFRYDSMERPRLLRPALLRNIGQMKMYAGFMTLYFLRNTYTAMKVTNPKESLRAMHILGSTLLMGAMFHGLKGTPFYSSICTLIDLFLNSGEDSEEKRRRRTKNPLTAESSDLRFRYEFLPEHFGDIKIPGIGKDVNGGNYKLSTVLERGPVSVLTDMNIGSRTSYDNMWFRSAPEGKNWKETALNIAEANLGPSVSAGGTFVEGLGDLANGDVQRGLEKMVPALFKGSVVAHRLAEEGAQTRNHDVMLRKEEITALNLAAQMFGFAPTRLAKIQDTNFALKEVVVEAKKEKSKLLDELKDFEQNPSKTIKDMRALDNRIDQHNKKYGYLEDFVIDEDTRERSLKSYEKRKENTERGLFTTEETYPYLRKLQRSQGY